MVLLAAMVCLSGCTRAYYRKQADARSQLHHRPQGGWRSGAEPGEFRINVDPRSRMFDPDDPDCPPMPPDDPISHQLMNCVDCKPGAPCWRHAPHARTPTIRAGKNSCPGTTRQQVVLDLQGAVRNGAAAIDRLPAAARNPVPLRVST